mmetsp:Transcript_81095/g.173418  ORF Transcript_81095/g.173418 Transcript_81095/m.173418 type:complete len:224 (-) Transcript_81095:888-1559(-)
MVYDGMHGVADAGTESVGRDRNVNVGVLVNKLDDPFHALATAHTRSQQASHALIVACLTILLLDPLQDPLKKLKKRDDTGAECKGSSVKPQANLSALDNTATLDIPLATLVGSGHVVAGNCIGDGKLVQGADKAQDPERCEQVESDARPLQVSEGDVTVAALAAHLPCGPEVHETSKEHHHEQRLEGRLEKGCQQQCRHPENHQGACSHASCGELDALPAAAS